MLLTHVTDDLLADGTVSESAYAVLPRLVEAAAALPPEQSVDFWVDMGFIVTAEDRPPVPADLDAGFSAALRRAEQAAVRSFLAAGAPARVCGQLALSCAAFAGHHIGAALWRVEPGESYLQLVCPGCGYDNELLTFFVDPVHPPFAAPSWPIRPIMPVRDSTPGARSPTRCGARGWARSGNPSCGWHARSPRQACPPKHRGRPSCAWSPGWSRPRAPRAGPEPNGPANWPCSQATSAAGTANRPGRPPTAWWRARRGHGLGVVPHGHRRRSRRQVNQPRKPRRVKLQGRPPVYGRTGTLSSRPTARPGVV